MRLFSGRETVLSRGMEVFLRPQAPSSSLKGEGQKYEMAHLTMGTKIVAFLKGVSRREEAEALIPFSIFLDRQYFPPPSEGEFYLSDLLEYRVIDHQSKEDIGRVEGLGHNSVQTVLNIRGRISIDLPLVKDFFPVIDEEKQLIEMILPQEVEGEGDV